ncbi:MAG: 1-acyl-sn-glycerol-3-phosphate acyltransferase [Bacteroidetes bacterium]|nr:1-acyl-sn-glycerol-3-phosphate acyltransferase [Bacteroidota bacterium]
MKIIRIALITTFRAIKVVLRGVLNKHKDDYFYEELKKWADGLLKVMKIEVIVKGAENLNEKNYIYIANHTNYIDIPIVAKALYTDKINFVYRKSLQKVPMLGFALKHSPFIPISRENISKTSISQANQILNIGSVIIFPEGTRSKTGDINIFKRGAFSVAVLSKKNIVPIAISGVEKVTPPDKKLKIIKGKVIVEICNPIKELPEEKEQLLKVIAEIRNEIILKKNENDKLLIH